MLYGYTAMDYCKIFNGDMIFLKSDQWQSPSIICVDYQARYTTFYIPYVYIFSAHE